MKLHELKPNEGAKKIASAWALDPPAAVRPAAGVPRARGARAANGGHLYRQGGSLPIFRRLPFIRGEGFTPRIGWIQRGQPRPAGRSAAGSEVNLEVLAEAGMLSKPARPVKILGRGEIAVALKVRVHRVSQSARAKIEAAVERLRSSR